MQILVLALCMGKALLCNLVILIAHRKFSENLATRVVQGRMLFVRSFKCHW